MADLAGYDYAALGRFLRRRLQDDGRGWRACAAEIGVTPPDLSRIVNGQPVSAPKVIAVCDWMSLPLRDFYVPPPRVTSAASGMFHGNSTETAAAAGTEAGRARA